MLCRLVPVGQLVPRVARTSVVGGIELISILPR